MATYKGGKRRKRVGIKRGDPLVWEEGKRKDIVTHSVKGFSHSDMIGDKSDVMAGISIDYGSAPVVVEYYVRTWQVGRYKEIRKGSMEVFGIRPKVVIVRQVNTYKDTIKGVLRSMGLVKNNKVISYFYKGGK